MIERTGEHIGLRYVLYFIALIGAISTAKLTLDSRESSTAVLAFVISLGCLGIISAVEQLGRPRRSH